MRSKNLTTPDDGQLPLLVAPPPASVDIPDAVVAAQPSLLAAINLAISASGLEDKEIYLPLKIDPGHWTRIRQGGAHFPVNAMTALMQLCGNEVPLRWLALQHGYRLEPREDAKDAEIRALQARVAEQAMEIETLVKYGVLKKNGG